VNIENPPQIMKYNTMNADTETANISYAVLNPYASTSNDPNTGPTVSPIP
jgi:hypothetical protein